MGLGSLLKLALALATLGSWLLAAGSLWWWPHIPLRATLAGTGTYRLLAFSPDGETLALGHSNRSVISLWDVNEVKERLQIFWDGSSEPAFSPDGRLLAVEDGGMLNLWDVATGQPQVTLDGFIKEFRFSPDSKLLAGHLDPPGEVRVWEVASGKLKEVFEPCIEFCWHPNRPWIFLQKAPGAPIRLRNIQQKQDEATLKGTLWLSAFSPSGELMAIADDSSMRLYDARSADQLGVLDSPEVGCLAFGPDARALATLGIKSGTIVLWDMHTLGQLTAVDATHVYGKLSFAPDGSLLALQSPIVGGDSAVWDLRSTPARQLFICGSKGGPSLPRDQNEQNIAFTSDGRTLILHGLRPTQEANGTSPSERFRRHMEYWLRHWHKRKRWASEDTELKLVEVASRQVYATLEDCDSWLMSPDGMTLATQSEEDEEGLWEDIKLWTVPRRVALGLRLLYTLGPALLLLTAWLAFRRRRGQLIPQGVAHVPERAGGGTACLL